MNISQDMRQGQGISKDRVYEGTVVDNNDPEMLGRIKVQIKEVFEGMKTAHLPWVIPDLQHSDGASPETGCFSVPEVGSLVSIQFEDGLIDYPRYYGYHINKKTILPESRHNYPNRKVVKLKNKCLLVIDKKTNELFIRNPGTLRIYVEGDLELEVVGNVQQKVSGDMNLEIGGNYNVKVGGSIHESATAVSVSSGGQLSLFGASTSIESAGALALVGQTILENSGGGAGDPGAAGSATLSDWPGIPGGAKG